MRDIEPILINSFTMITLVEVVITVVVSISDLMTLTVIVTIDPTLFPLTLAPILLIRALGTRSETPHPLIYCIGILYIIAFNIRWWWFRQVVNYIYLLCTPSDMF